MVAFILRMITSSASIYHLPLKPSSIALAHKLIFALDMDNNTLQCLHALLYDILGVPIEDYGLDRWQCPLNCMLALWALKEDGGFRIAADYTQVLAKWQYSLHMIHFMEALLHHQKYQSLLFG